jgi:hypothetical protein
MLRDQLWGVVILSVDTVRDTIVMEGGLRVGRGCCNGTLGLLEFDEDGQLT